MWCEYFEASWSSPTIRLARAMIRERWCCAHNDCEEPCPYPKHLMEVAERIFEAAEEQGLECAAACCDNCGEVVVHPALRPAMPDDDESIFAAVWNVPALENFEEGVVLCAACA